MKTDFEQIMLSIITITMIHKMIQSSDIYFDKICNSHFSLFLIPIKNLKSTYHDQRDHNWSLWIISIKYFNLHEIKFLTGDMRHDCNNNDLQWECLIGIFM